VLRAATGAAGRALQERGHKLDVGGESMVGTATATRQPRIALDVGQEPVRFANPLLPNTRSEIALPLLIGDRVLGALDVQSTQEAAFDEASVAVLQSMADQVAVAIANAQSFETIQRALETTTRLYEASRHCLLRRPTGKPTRRPAKHGRLTWLDRVAVHDLAAR
jgi:GAF domain-containing protein